VAEEWVVHLKQIQENVFTARVLVPTEASHAAVRVVNLLENTIHLPAETDLGTAEVAIIMPDPVTTVAKSLRSLREVGRMSTYSQLLILFLVN